MILSKGEIRLAVCVSELYNANRIPQKGNLLGAHYIIYIDTHGQRLRPMRVNLRA